MRINLHVIVIGAGLTGSFFLKEMIAYLHMKQENLIRTDITVFDPGSIGKEDLGAVYIREDLGQNRALLLSELLKEQYDYEVTAVPGDFSVGSPVLQISKRDYVFMVDCSDGSIPGDYRTEWKKLSAKRKLYLNLQMQSCIWMTEAERNHFFQIRKRKAKILSGSIWKECFW